MDFEVAFSADDDQTESQLRNSSLFLAPLEVAAALSLGSVVAGMLMTIWLPPPPDWAASVAPTLLRVPPPTTEARLWSTLTDLAGVGASYEDLDVCN